MELVYHRKHFILIFYSKKKLLKCKQDIFWLPFIKHHDNNYGGKLSIWVVVEIMTMGNLQALYRNLKTQYQKSSRFIFDRSKTMNSQLENTTYTRNHLTYYLRIFRYNFGRTPMKYSNHCAFANNGRFFDQILVTRFMFSDKAKWINYVVPEIP